MAEQLRDSNKLEAASQPIQEQRKRCEHGLAIILRSGLLTSADRVVEEHNAAWLDSPRQYVGHPGWIPLQPVLDIQTPSDNLIVERDGIEM